MNSAIEVKDTPSEDLSLDEDYIGVDFNIEATDNVDSKELPVSGFLHEPYPLEAPSEVGPAEPSDIVKQTDSVVTAENQESAAITPSVNGTAFLSPPTVKKQKRPYVRRSGSKNSEKASDPVVKLTKLSPRTIARHTNGISSSQEPNSIVFQSPPPPPRPSTPPHQMQEPPEKEEAASVVATAAEEEQIASMAKSLQSPPVSTKNGKSRSTGGGPSFLKRNPSKKKVVMPKGVPRSKAKAVAAQKAEAKAAAVAANGESSSIRHLTDEETEPCVECVKCSAIVKVSSARDHLTVCPGKPLIPTLPKLVNDENDQSVAPSVAGVVPLGPPTTPSKTSTRSSYGTRASSIRSVQSTYGPDACGLCGARGLSDGLVRYLHCHLHHQRYMCLVCGSMHARAGALVKHLQAAHGKEDRYRGPNQVSQLGEVLGRASILVCTDCGVAIHVLDAEAHSTNCKATPRFPLPSQIGYHHDGLQQPSPQRMPLAIDYTSPVRLSEKANVTSSAEVKTPPGSKRKYRGRLKAEPPEREPPLVSELPPPPPLVEPKSEVDRLDESPTAFEPIRKKAKVMLPNLSSPRGLRTLLPGSKGLPPSPPKRGMWPPGAPGRPTLSPLYPTDNAAHPKNLLSGAGEEVEDQWTTEQEEGSEAYQNDSDAADAAGPEQTPEESVLATGDASPAPQSPPPPTPPPPRDPINWKELLEPLLHNLLLRVKKALRKIQQLHCPVCLRFETHESRLEDICLHLRIAHNNHLLRGLGEDTQNRLFAEVSQIYMEDVPAEEADEYEVDLNAATGRKVLHRFCVEPLDKTYSCDLCNVNDLSVKEMVQHLRGAHGFRMYPCLECGQQFKTYGFFISHLVSTGKDSIYGCRLCGIVGLVSLYMLQSHLRTHSLCDICHTCFESQTALRKHMFNHQQDSPYACTVCQVSYKNYESLEMHLLWKHGTESKPCPTCQEKTWLCTYHFCAGAPASLAEVVDNPCVCTVCRLEFSKASMLKVHTRLHTGERPHKCVSCKKGFISKKLLAKHGRMRHSEAAINQAAVARAAADEIKAALERSGLKPKKVQQELLKLIGQQNAAKRSAASSRRVSTEEQQPADDKPKLTPPESPQLPSKQTMVNTTTSNGSTEIAPLQPIIGDLGLSEEDDDDDKPVRLSLASTQLDDGSAPVTPAATSRVGCSIFDIEDDDDADAEMTTTLTSTSENVNETELTTEDKVLPQQSNDEVKKELDLVEGILCKMATESNENSVQKPIKSEMEEKIEPMDAVASDETNQPTESEANPLVDLLDLLASAATSQQVDSTQPPLPAVEPVVVAALVDHDYCTLDDPPPDWELRQQQRRQIRTKKRSRHHHKKKRHGSGLVKKEQRYDLDLSSSSSGEEDEQGKVPKSNSKSPVKIFSSPLRPKSSPRKPGQPGRLSDSESSCCPTDCSCSSSSNSSSSSGSSSSSSSSSSSGSSDDSSSSSSSEDEAEAKEAIKPTGASHTAPASQTPVADQDDADVDVENNSEPPSSIESSSDSEVGVESDADVSVHESDLETSDSDSENKKRLRASPKNRHGLKKRKKKKKRRRHTLGELDIDSPDGLVHLPSSGNTVDDIINAVARGVYKSSSKRKKRSSSSSSPKKLRDSKLMAPPTPMQAYAEMNLQPPTPMLFPMISLPQTPQYQQMAGAESELSESKRGRGRRKRTDDLYWYDGDGFGDTSTKTPKATPSSSSKKRQPVKLKTPATAKRKGGRPTAKLKFTHNYDAIPPPPTVASPAPRKLHHVSKTSVHAAPSFEDPDRLYCYCRCPYDEVSQMIGCDASDCPYEWFHFECVGISEAPEGTYYCPECRLRPKYRAMFDEPFFHPQPPPQQII